eukprot:1159973-Pelagomonas_calceolata.AAC.19
MKTCSAAKSAAETHWPVPPIAAAALAHWEGASESVLFLAVDAPPALPNSCPKQILKNHHFTFMHIPACSRLPLLLAPGPAFDHHAPNSSSNTLTWHCRSHQLQPHQKKHTCEGSRLLPPPLAWRLAPPLAPVSQPLTLAANLREHRDSWAEAGSGLMLTNIRVLPWPPRHGCMSRQ